MNYKQQFVVALLGVMAGVSCIVWNFKATMVSPSVSDPVFLRQLPGYTGWARPETTVAGQMRLTWERQESFKTTAGKEWILHITCSECLSTPWLYARAFGPAILVGTVSREQSSGIYTIRFLPILPGEYTVEVIVTYSTPVDVDFFPLSRDQLPPPYYEGYFLRDFPRKFIVEPSSTHRHYRSPASPSCTVKDLTFVRPEADLWKRGYWSINAINMDRSFDEQHHNNVTLRGYQQGRNSLGFSASYVFGNGCQLEEVDSSTRNCAEPIRVVLVGDSVMRLQRDYLVQRLDPAKYKVSFMELYGGYLSCARKTGPHVRDLLSAGLSSQDTIVIFNSGMHDIHRLCGHQFADERPSYLNATELTLPCTEVYRLAMKDFLSVILQVPAAVRIFQTTHAAWPKFGNYGVAWDPRHAQEMPLDAAFCDRFNEIAVEEITKLNIKYAAVHMVDSYWMSLARPDNRETSAKADIGKKLSHPGSEVVSFMVRVWWQAALELSPCPAI